jgi:hypothetical protein
MTTLLLAVMLTLAGAAPRGVQAELDRIVAQVNGAILTRSDVRQARLLKLVVDVSSDDAVQRALEDRLLMLGEVTRAPVNDPVSAEALAARRREWQDAVGPANVPALLRQAEMSESALDIWLRDDVRIRNYVARQFGSVADADRAKTTADWLARLRQRAGLRP